jgi:hypothetical protein
MIRVLICLFSIGAFPTAVFTQNDSIEFYRIDHRESIEFITNIHSIRMQEGDFAFFYLEPEDGEYNFSGAHYTIAKYDLPEALENTMQKFNSVNYTTFKDTTLPVFKLHLTQDYLFENLQPDRLFYVKKIKDDYQIQVLDLD